MPKSRPKPQPFLHVHGVRKTYGAGHAAVHAVRDISLDVAPGESVLVMGPSGSGKTTLLTIIGSLLTPDAGTVRYGDLHVSQAPQRRLPAIRAAHLGFIFQSFNLLDSLNALENVAVVLELQGIRGREAKRRAAVMLRRLGLGRRLAYPVQQLSGGERQRVSVARALVGNPDLILADEPTANLDSKNGREVIKLLCEVSCQEERAVVIVSHDARIKESVHRVLTLEDGRITKTERGGHDRTCPHHRPAKRR